MKKFLEFTNLSDLEKKVEAIREITTANKQDIRAYLIVHNIPFVQFDDGSFGIDFEHCNPEVIADYRKEFGQIDNVTRQKYRSLGIVYVEGQDFIDFKIDLETRIN